MDFEPCNERGSDPKGSDRSAQGNPRSVAFQLAAPGVNDALLERSHGPWSHRCVSLPFVPHSTLSRFVLMISGLLPRRSVRLLGFVCLLVCLFACFACSLVSFFLACLSVCLVARGFVVSAVVLLCVRASHIMNSVCLASCQHGRLLLCEMTLVLWCKLFHGPMCFLGMRFACKLA